MALHPRVVHKRRETTIALPLYFSGYLLMKSFKEKSSTTFSGQEGQSWAQKDEEEKLKDFREIPKMALHPRVVHKRRETITALPLYYFGHLLKKSYKEKDFKKYYGELRGATLFLYNNDTQDTYTEKVELDQVKSADLESPYKKKAQTVFTLTLPSEEVQLKMESADAAEEWRGYILTVVKKEIPPNLQLLPGQMVKLQEILDLENRRSPYPQRPALPPRPGFLKSKDPPPEPEIPACFYDVTRHEAEKMLEENPENGSIILRPSTLPKNYALTVRQKTASGPVLKNYRVTSTSSGFVIELDTPVTVRSLDEVLKYFLEKTDYRLHPYLTSQPYDTCIMATAPPKCVSVSPPEVPKAQVAPMMRSQSKDKPPLLPPKYDEGDYITPDDHFLKNQKVKQVQMDGELQAVLKLRKENFYHEAGKNDSSTYMNREIEKANHTVRWGTNSSMV